jgi:hypothetical protein
MEVLSRSRRDSIAATFAGRAVQLWQGRGFLSVRRSVWRRHFLNEKSDTPIPLPKSEVAGRKRLKA